ncbi:hypothetical protein AB8Z38_03090 [Bradyrhizobium sp. LLZ17]|uniref:Transcriptional regulator n=1 Tax=Bradyrhizobium sp. LLZ17 TaxID=3239388 RepID=A0AB39XQD4_9BRAD
MGEQLDLLEEIIGQSAFTSNEGTRGEQRWRAGALSVPPQFERAKAARAAPVQAEFTPPPANASAPAAAPAGPGEPPAVPRVVTTPDELLDLIRRRRDALSLTHESIDHLTGWASGYASKVLSPEPLRRLGPQSLSLILGALALGIARVEFVEDPEIAARMRSRWVPRLRPKMRPRRTRGALLEMAAERNVGASNSEK